MTLIEVVIAFAILMIIISPVFSLTLNTVKFTKDADDKQEALAIAQKYMEMVKSTDITKKTAIEDGFKVVTAIDPVEQYKFPSSEKEDVKYNFSVKVYDENGFNMASWENVSGATVSFDKMTNTLDIESNMDDISRVKLELKGNSTININITNNSQEKDMEVYIVRDYNNPQEYALNSVIGKVKIHSNVPDDEDNGEHYRLYKVKIEVSKDGKTFQTLEGYKTFLK